MQIYLQFIPKTKKKIGGMFCSFTTERAKYLPKGNEATRDDFSAPSTKLVSADALCNILVQPFLRIAWARLIGTLAALSEASSVLTLLSVFGANRASHQN